MFKLRLVKDYEGIRGELIMNGCSGCTYYSLVNKYGIRSWGCKAPKEYIGEIQKANETMDTFDCYVPLGIIVTFGEEGEK